MKKTKKTKAGKKSLLGGATKKIKKLGKGKLTTTQKVVGGAALVALGLSYLAKRRKGGAGADTASDASAAEENLAGMGGNGQ
ncbi:hypothetical protein LJY25_13045 [Hymenobacter sp. BT175]|uniref:hypothetical protein n=1 Tax=Hymenobacter translucens TaxID=2886507 RepID=UPI001D0E1FAB|nr:hypothetical protein [Hymenobacter translucens]MCC2547375.1 hypothetical protein [Hymenobacter translucens]